MPSWSAATSPSSMTGSRATISRPGSGAAALGRDDSVVPESVAGRPSPDRRLCDSSVRGGDHRLSSRTRRHGGDTHRWLDRCVLASRSLTCKVSVALSPVDGQFVDRSDAKCSTLLAARRPPGRLTLGLDHVEDGALGAVSRLPRATLIRRRSAPAVVMAGAQISRPDAGPLSPPDRASARDSFGT